MEDENGKKVSINDFFVNKKGKTEYNKLCKHCKCNCKQSYRVTIVCCPDFIKKAVANV